VSITADWYLPNRVFLVRIEGDISVQDAIDSNTAITNMIRAGEAPVYMIVDTAHMGHFPTHLSQFRQVLSYLYEPKLRTIVVVGGVNILARFIASALTQVARIELKIVNTLDEAIAFLNKLDQNLQLSESEP
jgi:hypothetical protein